MVTAFNKVKFTWDSVEDPDTLEPREDYVVDPVFEDFERCQTLGPRYWIFGTDGDPVHDTIRAMTDEEIDTNLEFIAEVKASRRVEVNQLRDIKQYEGFTDANNINWSVSPQDVLNLNGVCTLISLGVVTSDQTWRDADNTNHTLTSTELVTLAGYMAVFVKNVYAVSWTHKANIDACTTLSDVAAYDISTGW